MSLNSFEAYHVVGKFKQNFFAILGIQFQFVIFYIEKKLKRLKSQFSNQIPPFPFCYYPEIFVAGHILNTRIFIFTDTVIMILNPFKIVLIDTTYFYLIV